MKCFYSLYSSYIELFSFYPLIGGNDIPMVLFSHVDSWNGLFFYASILAYVALRSMNSRRGGTSSPMSIEKM